MKSKLTGFADTELSRNQMKKIVGGTMCTVTFDTADGGCESITTYIGTDQDGAVDYAESKMGGSINGSSRVVGYNVHC